MNRQTGAGGLHTTPDASGYSVAALEAKADDSVESREWSF